MFAVPSPTHLSYGLLCPVPQEDLRTFVSLGPRAWTEARETLTSVLTAAVDECSDGGESDLLRKACWPMVRTLSCSTWFSGLTVPRMVG